MSQAESVSPSSAPTRADIEAMERRARASDLFVRGDGAFYRLGLWGWLWCLLFGPFYFAYHRAWVWFFLSAAAALLTFGASWLLVPIWARRIVWRRLLSSGFRAASPRA